MNKKGSHVGMIISFVVFITFIVFLYSVVRPAINIGQDKETIADYIFLTLMENISSNFTSTSVEIDELANPAEDCVVLQELFVIPEISPPRLKIKNEGGVIHQGFSNYDLGLADLIFTRSDSSNRFFRLYSSPKFPRLVNTASGGCGRVMFENYHISVIKTDIFPFKDNIDYLVEFYNNDYEGMKEELKLPTGTEFSFEFIESDGTKVQAGESPSSINVYATETPIQYVDDDANILSGFINIKVW